MSKTVLITGSSSGIGRATAEHFAREGWNVMATMRRPEQAAEWPQAPVIHVMRLDVTDPQSIREAIDAAIGRCGAIDAVVNNAGYGMVGAFEASTPEQVERQLATNVVGLMNVTRQIIPHFRERRAGTIVNLSSMGGRVTFPFYSVYHASKWAVEGFSESLSYELAPFGIRVKIIEPGAIKTDFYDRSQDVTAKAGLTAYDDLLAKAMPVFGRTGATAPGPELVARAIFRAASDDSWRLRYPVNSRLFLTLRHLIGARSFMAIVRGVVFK
jgi:NAD(P)-dependent dehydrogenase (short-subunit alcohol dehydrogenase family)